MNSPFANRNPGDFLPRPVSATSGATDQDKMRVTADERGDFRPKPVIPAPKESATTPVPDGTPPETEAVKADPAHPAAPKGESKATGESTQPAAPQSTPKSSSPARPRTPSKR